MGQGVPLMTYLVGIPQQAKIFAYAVGFGFLIGILYDVFRTLRLLFGGSQKKAFLISDILYALVAAFLTFLFALTLLNGSIRAYVLFGELMGFLIYYVSFGAFVVRLTDKIASFLRRVFARIFQCIAKPFLALRKILKQFYTKNVQKAQKKAKFSAKKSKFHLKSIKDLLYNQHVRVSSEGEVPPIDESDGKNGKGKKKKKAKT